MEAGLDEGALKTLLAHLAKEEKEEGGDADELDDAFADGPKAAAQPSADAAPVPPQAPVSSTAPDASASTKEDLRVLKAKVNLLQAGVRELTMDAYKNVIRIISKGRGTPK
mmetsp:Transcript_44424/g.128578  ORF Transcript_44424/g.128578 Transcript_44424/m.128578 type:complete len:111 (-) Transcript_44424:534-866(-)